MAPKIKLNVLRTNLLEEQYPFFTDEQLLNLLSECNGDVDKASYRGCLMKAQIDGISLGPLKVESNDEFWLKLARMFQPVRTKGLQRADER